MLPLPKFVRERLKVSVSPVGHPDPDVLTAFCERSLPAHERAVVMEHLARCGECRDVLALALPAAEESAALRPQPRPDWLRWPVLRWGAVAAGILIIGSVGIQQYRQRHQSLGAYMARNQMAEQTAEQDQVARSKAPTAESRTPSPEARSAPSQPEAPAVKGAPATSAEASPPGEAVTLSRQQSVARLKGSTLGGPMAGVAAGAGAGQRTKLAMNEPPKAMFDSLRSAPAPPAKQLPSPQPAQKQVIPSASETVEVESAAPAVAAQDQSQAQRQDQQLDYYRAQQQQSNTEELYAQNDKALSKAKAANQQVEVSGAAPAASLPLSKTAGTKTIGLAPVTWTITSAGGLQRSFDNGKTWQDVNVNAHPATTFNLAQTAEAVTVSSQSGTGKEQKSDEKKAAKPVKQLSLSPIFRAVSANGADVWAGGSAGVLYHSVDAGDHWTRLFPIAGSVLLTADITSVQFSDSQHGVITTTTPETWTTTDGGLTWQKH